MKITFEKLDHPRGGCLVTAEENGVTERLAYQDPAEALSAVGHALGIGQAPEAPRRAVNAPVAPSPDVHLNDEEPETLPEAPVRKEGPPATRRIGLTARKSDPPAGRR